MTRGESILRWARTILPPGVPLESAASLDAVDAWRNLWRPQRVRTLLVAESHVAPVAGDEAIRVDLRGGGVESHPERYVRLVYCLGYGESSVCAPIPENNRGTIQYWDLFGQVARGLGEVQPRRSASTAEQRLRWKLETLDRLRDRGIWLADASVVGLYAAGESLVTGRSYDRVVRESWRAFVWPDVAGDDPEQVWIIGRGVERALAGDPVAVRARAIHQPQSRDAEEYNRGLQALVEACGPAH